MKGQRPSSRVWEPAGRFTASERVPRCAQDDAEVRFALSDGWMSTAIHGQFALFAIFRPVRGAGLTEPAKTESSTA